MARRAVHDADPMTPTPMTFTAHLEELNALHREIAMLHDLNSTVLPTPIAPCPTCLTRLREGRTTSQHCRRVRQACAQIQTVREEARRQYAAQQKRLKRQRALYQDTLVRIIEAP